MRLDDWPSCGFSFYDSLQEASTDWGVCFGRASFTITIVTSSIFNATHELPPPPPPPPPPVEPAQRANRVAPSPRETIGRPSPVWTAVSSAVLSEDLQFRDFVKEKVGNSFIKLNGEKPLLYHGHQCSTIYGYCRI